MRKVDFGGPGGLNIMKMTVPMLIIPRVFPQAILFVKQRYSFCKLILSWQGGIIPKKCNYSLCTG